MLWIIQVSGSCAYFFSLPEKICIRKWHFFFFLALGEKNKQQKNLLQTEVLKQQDNIS